MSYTLTDAKKFIRFCLRQYASTNSRRYDFAIDLDGQIVGGVSFSRDGRTADIGYWLGKPYWGQGIMPAVLKKFFQYLKKKYKINRIKAKIFPWNLASARVLDKLGFEKVALGIQDKKIGKRYYDHVYYEKELRTK